LIFGGTGGANSLQPGNPGDTKIRFGSVLEFDDLRIGVTNFSVNFDAENPVQFNGSIFVASGGARFFPGRPISATITDRTSAEPLKDKPGAPDTEAIRLSLTFSNGKVDAFQFDVDTFKIQLGSFLTLTGQDVRLNTGAGADEELVHFGAIGAEVKLGSLVLGGEGRNFAFTGDGSFRALPGFGVFLSVGGATGDGFKWPSWLPIRIDAIGVQWDDIEHHPEDFVLTLSASVTGLQGLGGLQFSGSIEGVRIDVGLLLQGKFPIVDIASIGVSVTGKLFGGEINAALIGGILKLDSNLNLIAPTDTTTPVRDRVFFVGLQGGFEMPGVGGLTIRIALSELGPLGVFLSASVPGGILLDPNTGLSLNDFTAGVEFFKTLPSIEDPFALRNSEFGLPTTMTPDRWLDDVKNQVVLQYRAIQADPSRNGFTAAFTAPMTITGSAKIFSIY